MLGLERGIAFSYIGISNDFGMQGSELRSEVEATKRYVDAAVHLGTRLVRVFASAAAPGEDEEPVWEQDIACMKEITAYGRQKGIVVGLQNHNHLRITRTGDDVLRMLRAVDDPFFVHILDTGQYLGSPGAGGSSGKPDIGHDMYESIQKTVAHAVHVRAKIYRIQSGVEEWLDYPRIIAILRRAGYNGWLSIVYEGQEAEEEALAVPKAVSYLRRLLAEGDTG